MQSILTRTLLAAAILVALQPAYAGCRGGGGFDDWLESFKQDAAAQGVSNKTLDALDDVGYDKSVIEADRKQDMFSQSFLQFSDRMVASYRMTKGKQLLAKHRKTFDRIERDYGVPGPVIVAFWGLETDFGENMGKSDTLQSLATLAYDCRRPEMFRTELIAALKILQRGDLSRKEMTGAWAGELGQMQFIPTVYLTKAVDYDGDGRRNLLRSVPDVLASTANLLRSHGWQAGQPWLEEVRVPDRMKWEEADIAITHPRSQWSEWGVKKANGRALAADGLATSLLLPMGRFGPAFLAYPNFGVYVQWNQSGVYEVTAAYYATRLAGAPVVRRGSAKALSGDQIVDMQRRLERHGYDVGGADGALGSKTRAAVKKVQMQLGMPADSYPTPEFLKALRKL